MNKKILTIMVVMLLAVSMLMLVACGGNASNNNQSNSDTSTPDTSKPDSGDNGGSGNGGGDNGESGNPDDNKGDVVKPEPIKVKQDGVMFESNLDKTEFYLTGYDKDTNVKNIVIPNKVNNLPVAMVKANAFAGSNAEKITITSGIPKLEKDVFKGADKLLALEYSGTMEEWKNVAHDTALIEDSGAQYLVCTDGYVLADNTAKAFTEKGIIYEIEPITDTYIVVGADAEEGSEIVIPSTYDGKKVTGISERAFDGSKIGSIVIGNNVVNVGEYAFNDAIFLSSVTVGNYTANFGDSAFYRCQSLKNFVMPKTVRVVNKELFRAAGIENLVLNEGVTTIKEGAFLSTCLNIKINFPASIKYMSNNVMSNSWLSAELEKTPDHAVYLGNILYFVQKNITGSEFAIKPGTITVATYALAWAQFDSIVVPASVKYIDEYSFYESDKLKNITFEEGSELEYVGEGAFSDLPNVSITIPSNVSKVELSAIENTATYNALPDGPVYIGDTFSGYKGNITEGTRIDVRAGTKHIAPNALNGMKSVTSISLPDGLLTIGDNAFNGTGIGNINIPDSVTYVGNSALASRGLQTLYIGAGVSDMAINAIKGERSYSDSRVETVNSIMVSKDNARYYVSGNCLIDKASGVVLMGYQDVTIPTDNSVRVIANSAFFGDTRLKSIDIPDNIVYIGDNAFNGCSTLTDVVIGDGVVAMGKSCFEKDIALKSITIGKSLKKTGLNCFDIQGKSDVVEIHISDLAQYCNIDKDVIRWKSELFIGNDKVTNLVIPEGVTTIKAGTFTNVRSITSLTIPSSVTRIENSAFYDCINLATVNGGDNVEYIGNHAFGNTAYITNHADGLIYVGSVLYGLKGAMPTSVSVKEGTTCIAGGALNDTSISGNLTAVTLPSTLKYIGTAAFKYNNKLTNINLPAGLVAIGDNAFEETGLKSITLPNGIESISSTAFSNCPIDEVRYDGTVAEYKAIKDNHLSVNYPAKATEVICNDGIVSIA